ncbi:hypothetical protein CTEN210_07356 [Chaetoceros tenuissimus]|uniref:Nucleolar 27S pre-rRNA processing Urb2/Npa2 C-terminal domain-containing protein n=1 Tax=Chaetoceros tenuissimus TaxID=426638 RepID=A0AAD3CU09_9STRA|nr:hypothetical protein CTEN210_07356 [Chaetoceros tenuissimus]
MPKKRSRSNSDVGKRKKRVEKTPTKRQVEKKKSTLENHILNFSRHTQKKKQNDPFLNALSLSFLPSHNGNESLDVNESIEFFAKFLRDDKESNLYSKSDIASLILQWITGSLVQKQDKTPQSHWEAFTAALEILVAGKYNQLLDDGLRMDPTIQTIIDDKLSDKASLSASNEILSMTLTQGTMNKIIPCLLRVTFDEANGRNSQVQIMAARCFALIVTSKYYRPTVDYVCNTLFPLVDDLIKDKSTLDQNQSGVLYLVVKLLNDLQSKGRATNPKKTFQLMSSKNMLASFAKFNSVSSSSNDLVNMIVRKVFRFALFDTAHMDEFRSMNISIPILDPEVQTQNTSTLNEKQKKVKNRTNSSYQEALFKSFRELCNESSDLESVAPLLPILTEEYILQSIDDGNSSKRRTKVDITAKLQFCFWSALIDPLLKTLQSMSVGDEKSVVVKSIETSVSLLIKHDVYLPSYEDQNDEQLNFLQATGKIILSSAEQNRDQSNQYMEIMLNLFLLNHHVYHDKILRVILCTSEAARDERDDSTKRLLRNICSTYQKLRQLGHLVEAILTWCEINQSKYDGDVINSESFLHEEHFRDAMTSAIHVSPVGQIEECWKALNNHIVETTKERKNSSVSLATEFFVIVLRGLQVGNHSSHAIQKLCEETLSSSVPLLLSLDTDDKSKSSCFDLTCPKTISALQLWGFVLHVQIKCCFWLNEMPHEQSSKDIDGNDYLLNGHDLGPRLSRSIKSFSKSQPKGSHSLEAMQLLSCHKLQQLHSSIFQKQQMEDLSDNIGPDEVESDRMIEEAQELVNFIISSANKRFGGWRVVCENLSNWIPYANDDHVEKFLEWFFFILASNEHTELGDYVEVAGEQSKIPIKVYKEELSAAKALLHDASFYEIPAILDAMTNIGSSCMSTLLFPSSKKSKKRMIVDLFVKAEKLSEFQADRVVSATNLINILKSMISICDKLRDVNALVTNVLWIHIGATQYFDFDKKYTLQEYEYGFNLIFSCANLLLEVLRHVERTNCILDIKVMQTLLNHVMSSTKAIISCIDQHSHLRLFERTLLSIGSEIISELAIHGINNIENHHEYIKGWMTCMREEIKTVSSSDLYKREMIEILRPSINIFRLSATSDGLNSLYPLLIEVANVIYPLVMFSCQKVHDALSSHKTNDDIHVFEEYLYFMTDAIALRNSTHDEKHAMKGYDEFDDLTKDILYTIMSSLTGPLRKEETSILYSFGSLIADEKLVSSENVDLKMDVQKIVLDNILSEDCEIHPIITSSYARILQFSNTQDLNTLVESLLDSLEGFDGIDRLKVISAIMYCFNIMANVVKGHTDRNTVSMLAETIFPLSFELIFPFDEQKEISYLVWKKQIMIAQSFMGTLISKNDLKVLKGGDIANILKTLNLILLRNCQNEEVDSTLLSNSCGIITSLLKYYPKVLYGCVPLLTNAIKCIFQKILFSKMSSTIEIQVFEDLRKICELLPEHKDIFKKHVMYLIMFYVDSLKDLSLHPSTKALSEPLVYSLLECLSEFETKQLNAILSTTDKALFQSVFKNFQKNQYKGQF